MIALEKVRLLQEIKFRSAFWGWFLGKQKEEQTQEQIQEQTQEQTQEQKYEMLAKNIDETCLQILTKMKEKGAKSIFFIGQDAYIFFRCFQTKNHHPNIAFIPASGMSITSLSDDQTTSFKNKVLYKYKRLFTKKNTIIFLVDVSVSGRSVDNMAKMIKSYNDKIQIFLANTLAPYERDNELDAFKSVNSRDVSTKFSKVNFTEIPIICPYFDELKGALGGERDFDKYTPKQWVKTDPPQVKDSVVTKCILKYIHKPGKRGSDDYDEITAKRRRVADGL